MDVTDGGLDVGRRRGGGAACIGLEVGGLLECGAVVLRYGGVGFGFVD
jgi:hypothetical protein